MSCVTFPKVRPNPFRTYLMFHIETVPNSMFPNVQKNPDTDENEFYSPGNIVGKGYFCDRERVFTDRRDFFRGFFPRFPSDSRRSVTVEIYTDVFTCAVSKYSAAKVSKKGSFLMQKTGHFVSKSNSLRKRNCLSQVQNCFNNI